MPETWRMTLGANIGPDGVRFAVWAPEHQSVSVVVGDDAGERTLPMSRDDQGIWHATDTKAKAGSRYAYIPGDFPETPDFYSQSQPDGVHKRSEVINPASYIWSDDDWRGIAADDAIIYELHVGTYTPEGTWDTLITQLPELKSLGVTVIEIMPVAQCPGNRNWGYDGVYHFAPANYYGRPDDMRRFVDAAHQLGLAVILDVVYNHLGPEGNYSARYSPYYLSEHNTTDWGPALNWDGDHSDMVRQWAIDNACYWVTEFHLDGFRLDATHAMVDHSPKHIVQELGEKVRMVAGDRTLLLYAEDGRRDIKRARAIDRGGEGMDGVWADDFHHEMRVHLTNEKTMWLKHADGTTVTIAETIAGGYGPSTSKRGITSGVTPDDPGHAFVVCLQNHDQVGNRPLGERLHHVINIDRYKVASAILLFAPETPLLFMGQEFVANTPFCFFTDMPSELGKQVTEGRRREFAGMGAFGDPALRESIPDPQAESTFTRSRLDLLERETHAGTYAFYRDLIALRKSEPALQTSDRSKCDVHAAGVEVITVRRWRGDAELLLIANFGPETGVQLEGSWSVVLNSNDAHYGGTGELPVLENGNVTVPARTAAVLRRS